MDFVEIATFEAEHRALPWPWVAIDAKRARFAFATAARQIETRELSQGALIAGPSFALPEDLALPEGAWAEAGTLATGLQGFAIGASVDQLALVGNTSEGSVVCTLIAGGSLRRSRVADLIPGDFAARAVAFDVTGTRLWVSADGISADGEQASVLLLVDGTTHQVVGALPSAAFAAPASHELHVHPVDNAVLLLVACGDSGTFARVAGWSDGPPMLIPTQMDQGSVSCGFVGFSADSARVHFAEADELRTHAWPGLEELSSVEFPGSFESVYSGVVLGKRIYVDGQDRDDEGVDAVTLFDPSGILGARLKPPVPTGMWVGRLGADCIVTVEAKGDPARGRVVRVPALMS